MDSIKANRSSDVVKFEDLEPRLLLSGISSVECLDLTADVGLIQLEYDMPALQIEQVHSGEAGPLSRVVLGDMQLTGGTGQAMLPSVTTQVVIPYGYQVIDVVVETGERIVLDGQYTLTEGDILIASDGVTTASVEWIDRSNGYEIVGVYGRRGVDILVLNLYPVEYSAQAGTLSYFDSLALSVQLTPGDLASGQSHDILYRADEIRPLSDSVDNPAALASYEAAEVVTSAATLGSLVNPVDTYDYVIITNNALATASADYDMADFIAHKQSLGYSVSMVTVEDIYANYTGADQQEQIRNFIIDAYNGWETDFVLLAGDSSVIPIRKLLSPGIAPDLIDSDMYYQGLEGDWNADGDWAYGEHLEDSPDYTSDVYLGRAPFADVTKMSNWVYKTISYENSINDPYRYNALMVGEKIDDFTWSKTALEIIRTQAFNQDPDFQVDTLYEKDQAWGPTEIIAEMNSEAYAIYNHLGHGNGGIVMQTGQATFDAGLTNEKFFFAYSQACWSGYMGPGGSVAEHLMTHTRNGAAGLMFNSTYGWYYSGYASGPSQDLNLEFWDALFGEGINQIGAMNADSHADNLGKIDIIDALGRRLYQAVVYGTTIFGDPSLELVSFDLVVATEQLDWAYQDQAYDFTLESRYGTGPYTWSVIAGALPDGVSLAASTGVLSGTPTATGEYTFTVQVTDGVSDTASKQFVLPVLEQLMITASPSLEAYMDTAFSVFVSATGGTPSYSFTLTDGSLPTGLALNGSTGEIYGVTSDLGQYIFSVQVADSNGTYPQTDVMEFTLDVTQPPAEIRGQVFADGDGDGQRDAGEVGLNGWTVQLVDLATETVVATTVSADVDLDSSGSIDPETEVGVYVFTDVVPGDYEVRQVSQAGYEATTSWQRDGRVFVAEAVSGNVFFHEFDPADGSIINTFAASQPVLIAGYQGLAVGPDSLFYVDANDLLSPTLWELDLDTGAVIDSDPLTFGLMYAIKGLAYLDGELYIQYMANEMAVWDPATDSLVRTVVISANINSGLTGSPAGLLYATNTLGQVVTIDPADGSVLATLPTGLETLDGGLAYYDGDLLAVSLAMGSQVHQLDRLTGGVLDTFVLSGLFASFVGLGGDALPMPVFGVLGVTVNWADVEVGLDLGNRPLAIAGDMNADGLVNDLDIDLLYANFGSGVDPKFDLDGDTDADGDDVTVLLHDLLNTEYGDFNLDGSVDGTDLAAMKAGFGLAGGWANGDANGDLLVDGTDLAILKEYFGFVAPAAPAAPQAPAEAPAESDPDSINTSAAISLAPAPQESFGGSPLGPARAGTISPLSSPTPVESPARQVDIAIAAAATRAITAAPTLLPSRTPGVADVMAEALPLDDVAATDRIYAVLARRSSPTEPTAWLGFGRPAIRLGYARTPTTPAELTILTDGSARPMVALAGAIDASTFAGEDVLVNVLADVESVFTF